jgi:DNA mismatch endonuclease (patch repair protein)
MDIVTKTQRSKNMAAIRSKDTKPEKRVRSFLHANGLRFRLHVKDLPGKPDLVFRRYKTVVFIHGCFWHGHSPCKIARTPKSNLEYWVPKIQRNIIRDARNKKTLQKLGWRVITIWECSITDSSLEKLVRLIWD